MDKVKRFLEGYVEWIAVTLGAGFLLYMLYSYIYQPPVTVAVGPTTVTPGAIDGQIWEGPGKALQAQVQSNTAVRVPVREFGPETVADIGRGPAAAGLTDGSTFADARPVPGGSAPEVPLPLPANGAVGPKVAKLPDLPPMTHFDVAQGHSNVLPVAAGGTGGGGQPTGAGVAEAIDRQWVTVGSDLPVAAINAAYAAVNIPATPKIHQVTGLRLFLDRQELDATGKWGPTVQVQPPSIDALPPLPPAVPSNNAAVDTERNYLLLAVKSAASILRPEFYQVVEGDKWYVPGTPNPNPKATSLVEDKFDPAHFTGDPATLTKEQRDALAAEKKREAAEKQKNRPQPRPRAPTPSRGGRPGAGSGGYGGGGGGPGGGPQFLAVDAERPAETSPLVDGAPAMPQPQYGNPTPPDFRQGMPPGFRPGGMPPAGMPGYGFVPPAAAATPNLADLPPGGFDPAHQADFKVWAHDDTVLPGKTYRYRLRYVIASPVFLTNGLCSPQTLANRFSIPSPADDGTWSEPVNVESDSNFYAAGVGPRGSVVFDLFDWHNGVWTKTTVQASAGDTIGATEAKAGGVPATTGWTVVDIRDVAFDNADKVVLLASDNGTLQRQIKTDAKNANYQGLLQKLADDKAKTDGAPPDMQGGPGMPPGYGNPSGQGYPGPGGRSRPGVPPGGRDSE